MLKGTLFISTVSALLLVGCGSSDSTVTDTLTSSGTEITVERGPVYGALVRDANGQEAPFIGNGKYMFTSQPSYPIEADGGYIDVNRNGRIDAGEVKLQYKLQAKQGSVITLATTIASNAEIRTMIQEQFELSDDAIDNNTPGTNRVIAALSDEVYAYCVDNNLTPLNLSETQANQMRERIRNRINTYQESTQTVAALEEELMDELEVEEITESELPEINRGINQGINSTHDQNHTQDHNGTLINNIPASDLSDAQKEGLIFMIEEEKMARDVYEYLYTAWGVQIFTNIASSEQQHMDAVQALLNKYALDAPSSLDSRGTFENADLQALYDQLIEKGQLSLVDALEVGVAIEELDIADLKEIIEGGVPEDLEMVYENLLKGSYNHLNAFNNQLDKQ